MKCFFLAALVFSTISLAAKDSDQWPAFRGPNSSGVSDSGRPPLKIGPKEKATWKTDLPWSPSSVCVWNDRIFLTTFHQDRLETRCYSGKNGQLLWTQSAPSGKLEEYHASEGSPAASTPATDGQRVVVYFGSYGLICYDFKGRELWKYPLPAAVTDGNFGSGTSPIIIDDRVVVNRDQAKAKGSSLLAIGLRDGRLLWETPRVDSHTSYGTPILWKQKSGSELVVPGSLVLKAYDLKSGQERWSVRGLPSFVCTTPAVGEGLLFFAGWAPGKNDAPLPRWEGVVEKQDKNHDGYISVEEFDGGPAWFKAQDIDGNGKLEKSDWDAMGNLMKSGENVLLAIQPNGRGDITTTHVKWKQERGLPYVASPLYYDGRVYLVKDGGMFSSFEASTGRPIYQQERLNALGNYYASPVAAGGRIYVCSLDGKVTVVKAGGDKPEILHQADFGERIAGTPAIVGNRLYLRTQTKLYAFEQ
jgi:outer membrane protein assembly factor BamB